MKKIINVFAMLTGIILIFSVNSCKILKSSSKEHEKIVAGNSDWQQIIKKESQTIEIYWTGEGIAQIGVCGKPPFDNERIENIKLVKDQKISIKGNVFYRSFVSDAGITNTKTAYIRYKFLY